jgi:mono/diheme cytochrome c family protein
MTRQPVRAPAPANTVPFPFSFRPLLAGWKLLYFRAGRYREDERHDAVWNRGAYLAEGLGHCGACHSPRNSLGAEERDQHLGGGESEGWHAYAINRASQAPMPWDVEAMEFYLRNGWHPLHGIARGPMAAVTQDMGQVREGDVQAMATYIVSGMAARSGPTLAPRAIAGEADDRGATIYTAACASCHAGDRPLPFGGMSLTRSIGVAGEDPTNLLHVVLDGLPPSGETQQPIMPGFRSTLSDEDLLSLVTYLRLRFTDKPLWPDIQTRIRRASR